MRHFAYLTLATFILFISSCKNNSQKASDNTLNGGSKQVVTFDGQELNYERHGNGDYTVLLVHGWCIDQSYWSRQVDFLKSSYQVITLDLPGFGQSGKTRANWTIEAFGRDVNTLIDQLELKNVILVGHSMGGDVVLEAALNNPDIVAIIGIDTFKDVGMEVTEEVQVEIDGFLGMLRENFSEIAPAYADGALFHSSTDTNVRARVMEDFAKSDPVAATGSLESLFHYASIEANRLSTLKQKLYLINSDATPTNRVGLSEAGVDFEINDIPATGHYPMIEKPELFNEKLKETIQRIAE